MCLMARLRHTWQAFRGYGRHTMKKLCIRALLTALVISSCTLGQPNVVKAQDILAAIITADLPRYQQVHEAMLKVLQAGGFNADKLKIFKQTPNADKMSLSNSMRRAEASGAKLIVTYGSQATESAQRELKNVPLLFADVYDPVALKTVKNLAAPGTDASGATSKTDLGRLLEALIAIRPVQTIGVLYTKGEKGSEQQLAELEEQGKVFGISISAENARNPGEAQKLGEKLVAGSEALFLTESVAVAQQANDIIASSHSSKCMIFSQIPGLVEAGALAGLEADLEEQGKLVAVHALQVLQGKKVHLLPVREARQVTVKISTQTAARLGLTIPPAVASKAKLM